MQTYLEAVSINKMFAKCPTLMLYSTYYLDRICESNFLERISNFTIIHYYDQFSISFH